METIFVLDGDAVPDVGGEVVVVTEQVLRKLAATEHPRGPVAVFRPVARPLEADHCLVLWGLSDPGNVGTLIRTAAAFGLDVLATPGTADVWAPKVIRAAAGGHFRVGMGTIDSIDDLAGHMTVAAVPRGGAWPDEVRIPDHAALLIGNEAHGLAEEVAAAADVRVSIRMPGGAESFNAGVAGSILAYALFGR
jgi:TrmH family RNA methyltransferase